MKIKAISAIVSVVVAGAAIYGFAANNVIKTQASTDTEVTKATCGSKTEPMSDHVAYKDDKVCDQTEELLLMDDASEKDCEGGVCPSMEETAIDHDMMYMDADMSEHCEGEAKVCPSTDEK